MNAFTQRLHHLTHRVPGVPAHTERANARGQRAAEQRHGQRHHGHGLRSPNSHHQNPPRILVGWQHRIARLLHAEQPGR